MRIWLCSIVCVATLVPMAKGGEVFNISRFGGMPDDAKDDTPAMLSALSACTASSGATLELEAGQYDVAMRSSPPDGKSAPVLVIKNANGLTIDGHGAEIVCHDFATLFSFDHCRDLTLRNLKVDYDPLPFTAGQIIAEGNGYVDLKVEKHHPVQSGFIVESLLPYDPVRHRMGLMKDDLYQPGFERRTQQIAPGVLRVPVKRKLFKTGDWVILRHEIYSKNAFDFRDCDRVRLENVAVYTCPGMALITRGGLDFTLSRFNVTIKPGTGRWYSATADATHFNGTRGKVVLEDCLLESMGDDGTNVHNWYLIVTDVENATTFHCVLGKDKTWEPLLPEIGDTLEIGREPNPLVPMLTAKVASATLDPGGRSATIILQEPAKQPLQSGDVAGDASALPALEVRHCTIGRNRARAVCVKTRHAVVEGCTMEDISGPAVQVECDVRRWWEGMPAQDVIIRDNHIARVNFGTGAREAAIDIFADVGKLPSPDPVHRDILIEGNTIADVTGADIHVGSAENVTIRGNTFIHPPEEPIKIDHSRNVTIGVNTKKASIAP